MSHAHSFTKPTRLEELIEREVKVSKTRSPLDELLEEEELELIREAKKAKIEEILLDRELKKLEKEKRLRELKRELGLKDESGGASRIDEGLVKYLVSLPEDKRAEALKLIAMIKSMEGNQSLALIPLIMSMSGNKPSNNEQDVNTLILAKILDMVTKLVENKGGGDSESIVRLIKEIDEARAKVLEKEINELKERVSYDPVSYLTNVIRQLQESGLVGPKSDSSSSPLIQLKLKELDYKMQALMKKLETDYLEKMYKMQKDMAEFLHKLKKEEEKEKIDREFAMKQMEAFSQTLGKAIEQIGAPIGEMLGKLIGDYLASTGKKQPGGQGAK